MTDNPKVVITNTGFVEQVEGFKDKIPNYDLRSGNHYWIIINSYKFNPENKGQTLMDHESLVSVAGPACFYCERAYSPLLATRRCKGEPK